MSPDERESIACAIIAGGAARRLGGRTKALIEVAGATILERQLAVLGERMATIIIAANDPAPYRHTGLSVVPDSEPGQGPLAGLAAALAYCREPYLLAVAADMPYLDGRVLDLIIMKRRSSNADIIVPVAGGRRQTLCALYARRILPVVEERLAGGKRALTGLVADDRLAVIDIPEAELSRIDPELATFTNINTPADLLES